MSLTCQVVSAASLRNQLVASEHTPQGNPEAIDSESLLSSLMTSAMRCGWPQVHPLLASWPSGGGA
jgi:hypothetical protein